MRSPFVLPESVRSFSQYAEFNVSTETVIAILGYSFGSDLLFLPKVSPSHIPADNKSYIRRRLEDALRKVAFNSEMARREFLMAPIILEVATLAEAALASEHPFDISPRLHGSLDYLLQKENAVVVIEAKSADMSRGFTQLSAEMIALDQYVDPIVPMIYGAVTTGDTWRFGTLDRENKRITQDIHQFTIPDDLDDLLAVLVGILEGAPAEGAVAG
ncbi:MAG: hypothetical protein H8F28_18525 [Fibrella sp.]|nr:hypothetical protein [Armatimonadota bacterium]